MSLDNLSVVLTTILYMVSAVLFIRGIKLLGKADTARKGNLLSSVGMLIAVVTVMLEKDVTSTLKSSPLENAYVWAIAAIGIGGAILLGDRWTVLDPLASIVVGLMLVKVAFDLLKSSVGELTESSLPAETEREIEGIIKSFPGVFEPHNLRTRRIGDHIAIETHVRMDGRLPLDDAHERATAIERELKQRFGSATHVTIHMEPTKDKA